MGASLCHPPFLLTEGSPCCRGCAAFLATFLTESHPQLPHITSPNHRVTGLNPFAVPGLTLIPSFPALNRGCLINIPCMSNRRVPRHLEFFIAVYFVLAVLGGFAMFGSPVQQRSLPIWFAFPVTPFSHTGSSLSPTDSSCSCFVSCGHLTCGVPVRPPPATFPILTVQVVGAINPRRHRLRRMSPRSSHPYRMSPRPSPSSIMDRPPILGRTCWSLSPQAVCNRLRVLLLRSGLWPATPYSNHNPSCPRLSVRSLMVGVVVFPTSFRPVAPFPPYSILAMCGCLFQFACHTG